MPHATTVSPHTPQRLAVRRTVSIALPSSILLNAQSPELRVYLAGQVARAAAIFRVDEIIIFDEVPPPPSSHRRPPAPSTDPAAHAPTTAETTASFARLLTFLDTPQYLRKHLFPVSSDLRLVGLLNPLALPSHVSRAETPTWREAVSVGRGQSNHPTRYADAGLDRLVELDVSVPPRKRLTLDMTPSGPHYSSAVGKYLFASVASRDSPPDRDDLYWGYRVRTATCLSNVFAGGELAPRGYDVTIGTSERGAPVHRVAGSAAEAASLALPDFRHALIVFGGVQGLERSVVGDEKLAELGIMSQPSDEPSADTTDSFDVGDLFDFYLNTCPNQGSRTIRTEEAILISLAALNPLLHNPNPS